MNYERLGIMYKWIRRGDLQQLQLSFQAEQDPSMGSSLITYAILYKQYAIIEFFLQNGVSCELALITAADRGDCSILQLLLDHGADVNYAGGYSHHSPLTQAVSSGHLDAMILLLQHGANPNHVTHDGITARMYAERGGPQYDIYLDYLPPFTANG